MIKSWTDEENPTSHASNKLRKWKLDREIPVVEVY